MNADRSIAVAAVGLVLFARAPADGNFVQDVLPAMVLMGLGAGVAFNPVLLAAMSDAKPEEAGLASGLINTSQQVGGALGLAILATVANSRTLHLLHSGVAPNVALTKGFDRAFLVGACFAIVGAILTIVMISSRDSREHSQSARQGEPAVTSAAAS